MHAASQDFHWIADPILGVLTPSNGDGAPPQLERTWTFLTGLLDALDISSMLCDRCRARSYESVHLSDLLSRDLEAERLRDRMRNLALSRNGVECVQTRTASYRLKAVPVKPLIPHADEMVIVSIARIDETLGLRSLEAAQCRFGLTRQQARIAFLLVERRSDKEIAEALSISPHTVRRHVDEILDKLEIHSRKDVAVRLKET